MHLPVLEEGMCASGVNGFLIGLPIWRLVRNMTPLTFEVLRVWSDRVRLMLDLCIEFR